jgi:hypothetical protein
MIQQFCPEDYDECYTEGCTRCSTTLSALLDKEQIVEEALAGLVIVRKICNHYGIPFATFCEQADDVISKEKSKLKHSYDKVVVPDDGKDDVRVVPEEDEDPLILGEEEDEPIVVEAEDEVVKEEDDE